MQRVSQLNAEVSAASNEQVQGIDQVNSAVNQMDRVTQTNAANAEESASASQEHSSQARELSGMIESLVKIVSGNKEKEDIKEIKNHRSIEQRENNPYFTYEINSSTNKDLKPTVRSNSVIQKEKVINPEVIIPLDDAEFDDF